MARWAYDARFQYENGTLHTSHKYCECCEYTDIELFQLLYESVDESWSEK